MRGNVLITLSSVTPASSVFIILPALLLGLGGASVVVLAVAAIAAAFVGVCYAELSATYPVTGGEYTWAARLLGKPVGFAVFLLTLVNGVLITSVIALGTGEYLGVAFSSLNGKWTGVAVIVITTFLSCLNIRTNAWVTGIFLLVEILAIVVLVVVGVVHFNRGPGVFFSAEALNASGNLSPVAVGTAISLISVALFAYNGYGAAVYYVEETKDATRTIGRTILYCLAVTVVIELLPLAAVVLGAPNLKDLLASPAPMNYFLESQAGSAVNTAVSLGIAIAIVNAVIAIIIQISRLLFASARDRSWPDPVDHFLGAINPRFKTPINATLCVGAAATLCAAFVPLDALITATGAGVVVVYSVVACAALALRRKGRATSRGYRMPLWPAPPILLLAFMAYIVYQTGKDAPKQLLVAVATLFIGAVYYYIFIHPRRGDRWTLPDPIQEVDEA